MRRKKKMTKEQINKAYSFLNSLNFPFNWKYLLHCSIDPNVVKNIEQFDSDIFIFSTKKDRNGQYWGIVIHWDAFSQSWRKDIKNRKKKGKTKWRIKDQVYKWYCEDRGIPFKSLHRPKRYSNEYKRELAERMRKMHEEKLLNSNLEKTIRCPICFGEYKTSKVISSIVRCEICGQQFLRR